MYSFREKSVIIWLMNRFVKIRLLKSGGRIMKKLLTWLLLLSASLFFAHPVNADADTTANSEVFASIYRQGVSKGILTESNSSEAEFVKYCSTEAFPMYLKYVEVDPGTSFEQYVADENYFVSCNPNNDHPDTISADNSQSKGKGYSIFSSFIAAKSGYSMKAGDILVCHGTDSAGIFAGHAAFATSANYILEMPGPNRTVEHPSKESFFKKHTGKGKYVDVYRIKKHPHYADAASTYAYRHLYKNPKDRPKYGFQSGLYSMKDSYCSKYVYYAYYKVLPKGTLKTYNNWHIVHPFTFVGNFQGDFKASYLHQITSWK
jgi:hypothetical protein